MSRADATWRAHPINRKETMTTQDERIATLEADARIKAANLELAQARVAELEADAARWSAFRHAVVTEDESFLESLKNYPCLSTPATAAEIDAAIDAAMKDHHD